MTRTEAIQIAAICVLLRDKLSVTEQEWDAALKEGEKQVDATAEQLRREDLARHGRRS